MPQALLPTFAEAIDLICRCERGEVEVGGEPVCSWLEYVDARGIHHVPTVEHVDALAGEICALKPRRVIEVAAGDGALAAALSSRGVDVVATDVDTTSDGAVGHDSLWQVFGWRPRHCSARANDPLRAAGRWERGQAAGARPSAFALEVTVRPNARKSCRAVY